MPHFVAGKISRADTRTGLELGMDGDNISIYLEVVGLFTIYT